MNRFLKNWNYTKHAAAVSGVYLGIAAVGNALLGKPVPPDEKSRCPKEICRQMTKGQKLFNAILFVCYLVDMTAAYAGIQHLKKQYK